MTTKTSATPPRTKNISTVLSVSASDAWANFLKKLATELTALDAGQWLTLQKLNSESDWVQFAAQGKAGFRVETKSNWYRSDSDQLTPEQVQGLLLLGWLPPTGSDEESNPVSDPHGSPNFFVQLPVKLSPKNLDSLVTKTFINVLGVMEPDGLAYKAFNRAGNSVPLPDLGLKSIIDNTDENPELSQAVLDVIKEITAIPDLKWDHEGDIGPLNYKTISCFVRIVEDSKYVRFYAPLLMFSEASKALLIKINELNSAYGFMHLCLMPTGSLMAASDVLATPLLKSQIAEALAHFMQIADEFAIELEAEFCCDDDSEFHQYH